MKRGSVLILVMCLFAFPLFSILPIDATPSENQIMIQFLYNAGVRIETSDVRIYIDPYTINANFSDYDADIILITHPHEDHYNDAWVNALQKNDTVNIFPANMSEAIALHDGIGINPGDSVLVGSVNITAFYMYTIAPEGFEPSHPAEANWTSYIIDINGFRIFHAGDSKNITEYDMLSGQIDVALLPLGPGCQSMYNEEVVDAIQRISPDYFIPIHFAESADATFIAAYGDDIEESTECQIISLDNLEYYIWNIGPTKSTTSTTPSESSTTTTATPTSSSTTTETTTQSPDMIPIYLGAASAIIVLVVVGVFILRTRKVA